MDVAFHPLEVLGLLNLDTRVRGAAKQQKDLARVRAERDDLRGQAQLLARIVHVLENENRQLKEKTRTLEEQLADHSRVSNLTRRRRT
ncbi:hypothetical protein ACFU3O_36650 [Streptomyces antibioticus]|uniref:hypothetical protein n=1 Tax=Streptomyces antibioticus TaxID=1890 RepID=UPI0036B48506